MELKQVKSLLHQTKCGEMFMDGMGCSEPILTQSDKGLIDNFFVYLVNKNAGTVTGPLARMGLHADSGTLVYLISGNENPFSVLPNDTIKAAHSTFSSQEYERYASLYAEIRKFAFKEQCTDTEKMIIENYLVALKSIVNSSLLVFYDELAPAFFKWASKELGYYWR